MTRLVGALLVAGAAAAAGFSAARKLRARARMLEALAVALEGMGRELGFSLTSTPQLLTHLAANSPSPVSDFFACCAREYAATDGGPLSAAWAAAAALELPLLRPAESRTLQELGGVLGRYDGEAQRAALTRGAARFGEYARAAEGEWEKLGRVYGTLGLTAGAFLVILLY